MKLYISGPMIKKWRRDRVNIFKLFKSKPKPTEYETREYLFRVIITCGDYADHDYLYAKDIFEARKKARDLDSIKSIMNKINSDYMIIMGAKKRTRDVSWEILRG
jgi:hypothetical protein